MFPKQKSTVMIQIRFFVLVSVKISDFRFYAHA